MLMTLCNLASDLASSDLSTTVSDIVVDAVFGLTRQRAPRSPVSYRKRERSNSPRSHRTMAHTCTLIRPPAQPPTQAEGKKFYQVQLLLPFGSLRRKKREEYLE
ncbi:hypothetical protein FA10DRAFT_268296 [Acaromyces ingoldii]|uniref:Uncharacterized protein n=1 Tax=Acaromyces ingoldii TaxID=215250 RepID=A0A316YGU7_9BASI|nr:hypothetical protein FA10DRAFT_268296 [Acaromyces ingoldii]PWN88074.1 hypothetical protein FA10DRAFT_268296 [Acaromyces ingoldii]